MADAWTLWVAHAPEHACVEGRSSSLESKHSSASAQWSGAVFNKRLTPRGAFRYPLESVSSLSHPHRHRWSSSKSTVSDQSHFLSHSNLVPLTIATITGIISLPIPIRKDWRVNLQMANPTKRTSVWRRQEEGRWNRNSPQELEITNWKQDEVLQLFPTNFTSGGQRQLEEVQVWQWCPTTRIIPNYPGSRFLCDFLSSWFHAFAAEI